MAISWYLYPQGTLLKLVWRPLGCCLCLTVADCDDGDAVINPDATEVCDGLDNDCNGDVDEGLLNMSMPMLITMVSVMQSSACPCSLPANLL